MKKRLMISAAAAVVCVLGFSAQTVYRTLTLNEDGKVASPVDFWEANEEAIADALSLGTAAKANSSSFATAAQGAKADTAVQSGSSYANPSWLISLAWSKLTGVPNASASQAGLVTTGSQTFAGQKTMSPLILRSWEGTYGGGGIITLIGAAENNDLNIVWDASMATSGAGKWNTGIQLNSSGHSGDGSFLLWNDLDGLKRFRFSLNGNFAVEGGNISAAGTNSTLPNQTAASGASIMTRVLSDQRYGERVMWRPSADAVVNNTTDLESIHSFAVPPNSIATLRGVVQVTNADAASGACVQTNHFANGTWVSAATSGFSTQLVDGSASSLICDANGFIVDAASGTSLRGSVQQVFETPSNGNGVINIRLGQRTATAANTTLIAEKTWIEVTIIPK